MVLPQKITNGLNSKSEKIRALAKAGYLRTEIAEHLQIRYQHVRKVLVDSGLGHLGLQNDTSNRPKTKPTPSPRPIWNVEKLIAHGFALLGIWELKDEENFVLSTKAPRSAGVYVFALDGVVKYVGVTQRGLRTRMGHYVYGHPNQKTSARLNQLILNGLKSGSKIEVLIAQPSPLEWNGLPVDSIAGLEIGLIKTIQPEWNMQGSR